MSFPTHYDAQGVSEHIIHGDLKFYLEDSVDFTVERKPDSYRLFRSYVDGTSKRVYKVFAKGNPEFSSKTNGGYTFTISVIDKQDETKILNKVCFSVDRYSQKIESVEILLGD